MSWREGNLKRAALLPDYVGRRFGRLVVVGRQGSSPAGKRRWLCRCDCGREKVVTGGNLIQRLQISCGCFRDAQSGDRGRKQLTTHGVTAKRARPGAYGSWASMRERCLNPNFKHFHRWGGRGITICERWDDFLNFLADMGERPPGKSLDRYPDPDGNYEPGNCRWATPLEQARNKSKVKTRPIPGPDEEGVMQCRKRTG